MAVPTKVVADRLVLSPHDALTVGGAAEEFESVVQSIFKSGYRHLVVDLTDVTLIDSAGIRALVRGLTTSQRLGGSFVLVSPRPAVSEILRVARLDTVFDVVDRLDAAVAKRRPWRNVLVFSAGLAVVMALAFLGSWLPSVREVERQVFPGAGGSRGPSAAPGGNPFSSWPSWRWQPASASS